MLFEKSGLTWDVGQMLDYIYGRFSVDQCNLGGRVRGSQKREGSVLPCSLPVHGAFNTLRL